MNILILNYEYPPLGGGGGKQSLHLARHLARDHQVHLLTAGWDRFGMSEEEGVSVHRLGTCRQRLDRCSNLEMLDFVRRAWGALPKLLDDFSPDAVLVFFTIPTGLLTFHPRLANIPYVVSVRGSDVPGHNPDRFQLLYKVLKPVAGRIWRRARAVVCNSNDLRGEVQSFYPNMGVSVIPNGIDLNRFQPLEEKCARQEFILLYAGRLIPLKQVDLIIKALPEIRSTAGRDVRLRIVGTGSEEGSLKRLAQDLGVADGVTFLGNVDHSVIQREFQQADLYVQLSRTEGMSNTILEAMACGLPVVTTPVGGVSEFMADNGFVVTDLSSQNLARTISCYLADGSLARKHGVRSRGIVQPLDWNTIATRYERVLRKAADARHEPGARP